MGWMGWDGWDISQTTRNTRAPGGANNQVASIVGLIICSLFLVWHASALGVLGKKVDEALYGMPVKGELDQLSLVVISILLGVCLGYIMISILLIIAVKKENAGLLFPWIIITVLAIIF